MKNLLQKSLKQLTVFASLVFACSIPSYFLLVDWIWLKELDENNYLIAERIANEFNEQRISEEMLAERIHFWNEIQPVSKLEQTTQPLVKDSLYTIRRQNPYVNREAIDRFRCLYTTIMINDRYYALTVETNVEETEETVAYIAVVTLLFFLILVLGFWILNRRLSKRLWQPFQDTLHKLKSFQLNRQEEIHFMETDTVEFAELNATLDRLLQQSIRTYRSQKEFTENASHELQTPLAILKNKVDILLQSDDLTQKQYILAEEMNQALIRSAKINKNLLLLAKIENNQFDSSESVVLDRVLQLILEDLDEYFKEKEIDYSTAIHHGIVLPANAVLIELLMTNLLINAIRYTDRGESISVSLSESRFEVYNSGTVALDQDLLFQRFARLSTAHSGSGLGLSIVYEIGKLHGWEVSYRFENGGHIFSVTY